MAGAVTVTVTSAVDSMIGLGVIVVVRPTKPRLDATSSATAAPSLTVAPGTMTARQAS